MKLLLIIMLSLCTLPALAQDNLDDYLKSHHYAFSLDSGFDQHTIVVLKQKLSSYKLVILGEGGSHFLRFYEPLRLVWVRFLHEQFGMTHFFMETGHSSDLLCNQYLQTGDTAWLPVARFTRTRAFWTSLLAYNKLQMDGKTVHYFGIDFERTHSYLQALRLLIPDAEPQETIKPGIDLIRTSKNAFPDCDYILSVNATLKKALLQNRESFKQYLSTKFDDFEWMVMNNGSCADSFKNRNDHMAENFLRFDKKFNDKLYYGQLGMAHTILSNKNTASIINNSSDFKNQVCVVNTYCYNCTTTEEPVSNWQLRTIEKDILEKLLKYCDSDFTLFDFSDKSVATSKFRKFGQYLIIAKNQR